MEIKKVLPAISESYEQCCHESGIASFCFDLRQLSSLAETCVSRNPLGRLSEFSRSRIEAIHSALTMTGGDSHVSNRQLYTAARALPEERRIGVDTVQSRSFGYSVDQSDRCRRQARHADALRAAQCKGLSVHPASDRQPIARRGSGQRGFLGSSGAKPSCFKAKSQVSTWLLAIARNKALSALRRRSDEQLNDGALDDDRRSCGRCGNARAKRGS